MEDAFDFVSVNPSLSGLVVATEELGGACVGVLGIPEEQRGAYEAFHGSGASMPPDGDAKPRVAVVELPFSAFPTQDPAVSETTGEAARVKSVRAVLFRAPWQRAARIGLDPAEYAAAVSARFPADRWQVSSHVSDDRSDLFLSALRVRNLVGPPPTVDFPAAVTPTGDCALAVFLAKGYPVNLAAFLVRNHANAAMTLARGAVDLRNADRALRALLASAKGVYL